MTARGLRRAATLLAVLAVWVVRPVPLAATPAVGAQGDGATAPQVPAAGIGITPEVAALPASSPELDAAEERLADLLRTRDDQTEELAATDAALADDTATSTAVRALAARRTEQVAKAAAVDDRTRRALTTLMVDRFVEGDHLLEGLDPMLSAARRDELGRQMVLGEVGTERLMAQRRHTTTTLEELQGELDEYTRRAAELDGRIAELGRRGAELRSSLDALGPRIDEAGRRRDAARGAATIDGTDMSVLALDAYWRAAQYLALTDPTCRLSWPVLAGIGRTESRHGTYRGAVLGADGAVAPPIYGPELDGSNAFAVVPDSDGGGLDGTASTDRAVGPMQFLPGTWRTVGTDLTGDGDADPQNLYDAAAAAGVYLCRSGPGLDDATTRRAAVLTYNRSQEYADIVDERAREYATAVPLS